MKKRFIIHSLFLGYIFLMIWLLFLQRLPYISYEEYANKLSENINLIPFKTIIEYLFTDKDSSSAILQHAFINLAGNIVMFIPLGFFLPLIKESCIKFRKTILLTLAIICAVELIQLFTLAGSLDIDDLILNTIGSATGYLIQNIIFKNKH